MNKLIVGGAVVLALVGFIVAIKEYSIAPPGPAPATSAAAPEAAASTDATAAGASTDATAAGETIAYVIQACVDDKATLVIQGDQVMWTDMSGRGLSSDACPDEARGKTIITTFQNDDSEGVVQTFTNTTPSVKMGPLKVGMPFREPLGPATLELLSTTSTDGTATLIEQPTGPKYRARIIFNNTGGFAHVYVAKLTVQYK